MPNHKDMGRMMAGAAIGLLAMGCGMSTSHVALPMANTEAPKVWTPIMQCSTERGFKYVDGTKDADPHVRVSIDPNTQLDIVYQTKGDHVEMELIIWGQTTDADREKILGRLRREGDSIWACAQQKMSGGTAAPTAPPAGSASTSATPPP
jgi:hypothetical protein